MTQQYLQANPCCTVKGPEDGFPLVLIHGSVVSKESWIPQLEDLSDEYRVIAVDLPGHGTRAGIPFSYERSSRILGEVIRSETDQPAAVAGLSLGGYAAIEFAAANPELVRVLILSGCRPRIMGALAMYLKTVGWLMKNSWLKTSCEKARERVRKMYPQELKEAANFQIEAGVFPEALGDVFLEMAGKDYAARLKATGIPAFLMNGELDRDSRRGEELFLKADPGIEVKVIPGARHAVCFDQPRLYNAALREILEKTLASEPATRFKP